MNSSFIISATVIKRKLSIIIKNVSFPGVNSTKYNYKNKKILTINTKN